MTITELIVKIKQEIKLCSEDLINEYEKELAEKDKEIKLNNTTKTNLLCWCAMNSINW